MKHPQEETHQQLLYRLSTMPRKIIALHDHDNTIDFVLHELCNKNCLNMDKAAYFVDNPDFDHCKGIAGFSSVETYPQDDIWKDPQSFRDYVQKAPFNIKVRSVDLPSYNRETNDKTVLINSIGNELSMENPMVFMINLRHGNHGILLCKPSATGLYGSDDDMVNWLSYLGLCPIH